MKKQEPIFLINFSYLETFLLSQRCYFTLNIFCSLDRQGKRPSFVQEHQRVLIQILKSVVYLGLHVRLKYVRTFIDVAIAQLIVILMILIMTHKRSVCTSNVLDEKLLPPPSPLAKIKVQFLSKFDFQKPGIAKGISRNSFCSSHPTDILRIIFLIHSSLGFFRVQGILGLHCKLFHGKFYRF